MDMVKQMSLGEQLLAGGAVLMLIASVLPWYHFSLDIPAEARALGITGGSVNKSAWGPPGDMWGILAVLIALALGGAVIAQKVGNVQLPNLGSVSWGQAFGGGAAAVVVLVLLKAWRILAVPVGSFGFGFFIGIIATAAIAYGGYLLYSADRGGGAIRT